MWKKEKGFTLIELLLVLLSAVLFASAGLSVHNTISKRQLYIAAREVQTLIRLTQDQAYGQQDIQHVSFYTTQNRCAQISNHKNIKEVQMPKGINLESTNFPDGKLYFRRQLTPSRGGSIYMYSRAHKVIITVLPVTGRVKIYPITKM